MDETKVDKDLTAIHQQLTTNLALISAICTRLEAVADQLPDNVDTNECRQLALLIYPSVLDAHQYEEKVVFPLLRQPGNLPGIADTIERLRFEHWEDESFAAELQESMCRFAVGRDREHVETLSWMLRGFFEGVRRHMAFEREYILPMLSRKT